MKLDLIHKEILVCSGTCFDKVVEASIKSLRSFLVFYLFFSAIWFCMHNAGRCTAIIYTGKIRQAKCLNLIVKH